MLVVQLCCARHCELPLSKMGNKGLFPGVAVPLAFFCTLFFRHRKKSVSAPWDGQSQSAPESARQAPPGAGVCACGRTKGLSARPLETFGSPPEAIERPIGLQALLPRRSRHVSPRRGQGFAPAGALGAFLGANHRRVNPRRGLCLPPSHLPFFLLY